MPRRQIRTTIRLESVILAIRGAVIGVLIGTGFGPALVSSLRSQGISVTAIPTSSLVLFLVLSTVLGPVADGWPARRGAHLGVLTTLSAE